MAKRKSGSPRISAGKTGIAQGGSGPAGARDGAGEDGPAAENSAGPKLVRKAGQSAAGKRLAAAVKPPRSSGRKTAKEEVPIVAVGASAGGLEAFTQLLQGIPPDTGMAFVLVSHLSHQHKSMLSELLGKATEMPVAQVVRRVPVRPNRVYVIPPNVDLDLIDGVITTSPLSTDRRPHMVIDHFMRSLAQQRKNRAIGVLLSGTGSDGTFGLAAIKAEGGVTFTQDDESARFADMPRNAWAAGSSDYRMPPDKIAAELARVSRHPYLAEPRPNRAGDAVAAADSSLIRIFGLVRKSSGVDFTHYKPPTIRRRISRRMLVHRLDSLAEYVELLRGAPDEVEALFEDLLINVTGFFRDHEMFEVLKQEYLRPWLAGRPSDNPIRAWVPGCSTGEEAYSIAICLLETLGDRGANQSIQVFGTDISENAIRRARSGKYPENISADVSPERLRRYFVRTETGYDVAPLVRDLCIFAPQNLINDPPFSRMDLISCRNVLIYLGPSLQKRVLSSFHYALSPGGVLVLGTSETVGAFKDQFQIENKKFKIYNKVVSTAQPVIEFGPREPERARHEPGKKVTRHSNESNDVNRQVDQILLKRFAPAGVVINPALDIVHFRGQTSPFLEPAPGQASLNLLKMAREGLLVDLRGAVHQAQRTAKPVRKEGIRMRAGGGFQTVNIEAIPIPGENETHHHQVVVFEISERAADAEKTPPGKGRGRVAASERDVAMLREQLASTQQDLHSIIEEQEANNEELQSANEEILSSNEELQSTNEELETAKEELQATNEELITVNEELQNRNAELTQANNDLTNLLASVDIVIIMVSQDLRIRRFTPSAQRVMNLIAGDAGRPLRDINTRLQFQELEKLIAEVIDTMAIKEEEIQDADGRWYSMRVKPYRTLDNKIEGAVLTLVEVDELKRTAQRMQLISRVFQVGLDAVAVQDMSGNIIELNDACARVYGWTRNELLGMPANTLVPPDHRARTEALLEKCRRAEEIRNVKGVRWTKGGKRLSAMLTFSLIKGESGEPAAIATIARQSREMKGS